MVEVVLMEFVFVLMASLENSVKKKVKVVLNKPFGVFAVIVAVPGPMAVIVSGPVTAATAGLLLEKTMLLSVSRTPE